MPDDTILCWRTSLPTKSGHVTVADYHRLRAAGDDSRSALALFIKERLSERYIDPIAALSADEKNGFAVMALSCLLIETLESFHQGWPKSPNSGLTFCNFFDRQSTFHDFKGHAQGFYQNVRCGILHQGETTGKWSITRKKGSPLFDPNTLTVHAVIFHRRLAKCVRDYADSLAAKPLTDPIWKRFIKKMDATVKQIG